MRTKTKLNCRDGNTQCGGKCQPKTNKCPSEKGLEVISATNKFTKLIPQTPAPKPKDLESLYKDYESLISSESKKQSRAKIRGLPNEKELKKELLRAEEKAWVFVRLMREKKRLSKKGEEVRELEALLQKIADGDAEAIAEALASLDAKTLEKRKAKVETKLPGEIDEALDIITSKAGTDLPAVFAMSYEVPEKFKKAAEKLKEFGLELFTEGNFEQFSEMIAEAQKTYEESRIKANNIYGGNYEHTRDLARSLYDSYKIIDRDKFSVRSLEIANNLILSKIQDKYNTGDITGDELSEAEREKSYLEFGDSIEIVPALGDELVRNKTKIPPLPQVIADGNEKPVDESFRNLLEESKILVQVSAEALTKIIKDGRFKNTYERGSEPGISAGDTTFKKLRNDIERDFFGVTKSTAPKDRPIYGYVESQKYINSAHKTFDVKFYGDVKVVLKDEVRERSSITIGDSLVEMMKPTPMLKPTTKCYSPDIVKISHKAGSVADLELEYIYGETGKLNSRFVEAQIFGGISLEDIEFVVIPKDLLEEFPKLIALCIEVGVSYKIV